VTDTSEPTRAGDGGFWCALCATHRPTATEVYAHAAKEHPSSRLALNGLREPVAGDVTPVPDLPVYINYSAGCRHDFTLPGGEAVAARLRQVQAAFAASQSDLTRTGQERDAVGVKLVAALRERDQARGERDRFIAAADKLHGEWLDLKADLAQVRLLWAEESARLKTERNDARRERDLARAEVATASKEVKALRAEVARLKPNREGDDHG
jgi:hypothetical protein